MLREGLAVWLWASAYLGYATVDVGAEKIGWFVCDLGKAFGMEILCLVRALF